MPPDTDDVGHVLRPNGQPADTASDIAAWLGKHVFPALFAVLLSVLTWNVGQMNDKLDALQATQVAGQIQAQAMDGRIQQNASANARQDAEIDRLRRLHGQ